MARASPVISCTLSPLVRSAIRKAAVWASEASPAMISCSTAAASSADRSSRAGHPVDGRGQDRMAHSRKFAEQGLALLGEHRLGVELHALGRQLAVAEPHHHVAGDGGALEAVGQIGSTTSEW